MSVIDNQEHLVAQTQLLYDELLNSGKYAEAIAIGKLILDLSVAYKELATVYPSNAKSDNAGWIKSEPFGTAFGQYQSTLGQINQTLREVTQPRLQNNQPPQASQYAWADGFQGVVVPPRETDAPNLPNPNNISSQPRPDYWEDTRRQ